MSSESEPEPFFLRAVDAVSTLAAALAALMIAAIAIMILAEVFARWQFNYSLSFAWEYSAYCMAMAIFCAAAYTLRTGGHIRVSLLSASVPPWAAWWIDLLATIAGSIIASYLALALIRLAWRSFQSGSLSATISATPLAVPQGIIAFGAVLLALQLILRIYRLWRGLETEQDTDAFQVD